MRFPPLHPALCRVCVQVDDKSGLEYAQGEGKEEEEEEEEEAQDKKPQDKEGAKKKGKDEVCRRKQWVVGVCRLGSGVWSQAGHAAWVLGHAAWVLGDCFCEPCCEGSTAAWLTLTAAWLTLTAAWLTLTAAWITLTAGLMGCVRVLNSRQGLADHVGLLGMYGLRSALLCFELCSPLHVAGGEGCCLRGRGGGRCGRGGQGRWVWWPGPREA